MLNSPEFLLVTAMKNEGPYILEWVAHHMSIGVEHFIIVTNHCDDGTNEILERLQQLDIVTLVMNPRLINETLPSWHISAHNIAQHYPIYKRAQWILHCDVDEFVQVKVKPRTLQGLVQALAPLDVLSLTSVPFNSNGLNVLEDRPVVSQFLQCDRYLTKDRKAWSYTGRPKMMLSGVKPLFRNEIGFGIRGNHRPYLVGRFSQIGRVWKNGSGQEMPKQFTDGRSKSIITAGSTEFVQLNHYAIRSVESAMLKFHRGDAVDNARLGKNEHYFKNYDNTGEDMVQFREPSAKAQRILRELHADRVLGPLHKKSFQHHKSRFLELLRDGKNYLLARRLGYFDTDRRATFLAESAAQRDDGTPAPAQVALPVPDHPHQTRPAIASLRGSHPLNVLERLALRSFVDAGHPVTLFASERPDGLPEEVSLGDPRDIYQPQFPIGPEYPRYSANYVDFFRLHMIRKTGMIWVDLLMICLRPFLFPAGYAIGKIEKSPDSLMASTLVLGLPPESPALKAALAHLDEENPIPPFLKSHRRAQLRQRQAEGERYGYQDLPEGMAGYRLLSHCLTKSGEMSCAVPLYVFSSPQKAIYRALAGPEQADLVSISPEAVSLKLPPGLMGHLRNNYGGAPAEGSYIHSLCQRHGIAYKAQPA